MSKKKNEKRMKKNDKLLQQSAATQENNSNDSSEHSPKKKRKNEPDLSQNKSPTIHIPIEFESKVYCVNFCVFISPEFKIDPSKYEIGIFSDYNDWNKEAMQKLKFIKLVLKKFNLKIIIFLINILK